MSGPEAVRARSAGMRSQRHDTGAKERSECESDSHSLGRQTWSARTRTTERAKQWGEREGEKVYSSTQAFYRPLHEDAVRFWFAFHLNHKVPHSESSLRPPQSLPQVLRMRHATRMYWINRAQPITRPITFRFYL